MLIFIFYGSRILLEDADSFSTFLSWGCDFFLPRLMLRSPEHRLTCKVKVGSIWLHNMAWFMDILHVR